MSFALYGLGTLILIAGVIYICHLLHVPIHWIVAIGILLDWRGTYGCGELHTAARQELRKSPQASDLH